MKSNQLAWPFPSLHFSTQTKPTLTKSQYHMHACMEFLKGIQTMATMTSVSLVSPHHTPPRTPSKPLFIIIASIPSAGTTSSSSSSSSTTRAASSSTPISRASNSPSYSTYCNSEVGKEKVFTMAESRLHSSLLPSTLLVVGSLPPGAESVVRSLFGPFVELVKSWDLPNWLVHWGHPVNMAVVLFAMGGYGSYLGFRIKFSNDMEEKAKAKAKDLHPKLLGGMFFFFALGATGGITSLLTSDKPIFESPHAVTGFIIGLALLAIQTILPALFEGNPGLRNVHGTLGTGIMTLFVIHAALGLQLGLSY